jgi:hypothetical protein
LFVGVVANHYVLPPKQYEYFPVITTTMTRLVFLPGTFSALPSSKPWSLIATPSGLPNVGLPTLKAAGPNQITGTLGRHPESLYIPLSGW